jgi:formyl-CoA transferase
MGTVTTEDQLPLAGVRVIDFTQVFMGPVATQTLADFGADVVKIERPGSGDLMRWSIPDPAGPDHPGFQGVNRNKRSIAVNLGAEEGRAIVRQMLDSCDIVVNNFRPSVLDRLGFSYQELRTTNPGIIFAQGTGFGTKGPYVHKGGQDIIAQALTGVMARKQSAEHPLAIYGTSLADYTAGMHLVQAILIALLGRERTGAGQFLEVSLYDALLAMQALEAPVVLAGRDYETNWAAMPLVGAFPTTDGAVAIVGAFKENPLRDICLALGLPDLSADPRYASAEAQAVPDHKRELQEAFADRFRTASTSHWLARLEEHDVLCAQVQDLGEALADPQTASNHMVVNLPHSTLGTVSVVASPLHLSATPPLQRSAAPTLGEHSDEILIELGLEDQIARLREEGVVG